MSMSVRALTSVMGTKGSIDSGAVPVKLETWYLQTTNIQHIRAKCGLSLCIPPCHEYPADLGAALTCKLINYKQD